MNEAITRRRTGTLLKPETFQLIPPSNFFPRHHCQVNNSSYATIEKKTTDEQYFDVVLLIMVYKVVLLNF